MSVSDLIEILKKLDGNKTIKIEDNVTYDTAIGEMGEWELFDPQIIESEHVYLIISKKEK